MITDLLLELIKTLIQWAIALRPVWQFALPTQGIVTMIGMSLAYDQLLPIPELLLCSVAQVSLVVGSFGFKWTIKVVDYIADVIP